MNLRKHELIGLEVAILRSTDPSLVGVRGLVVDETRNTLVVEAGGREKRVPKEGARFRFESQGGGQSVRLSLRFDVRLEPLEGHEEPQHQGKDGANPCRR